jgi:hypothetical protein
MVKNNVALVKPLAFSLQKRFKISGFNFVQVSKCYPEAYDGFDNNWNQVGYVCLRWGCLSCKYPNVNGEKIYESFFERDCMGEFDNDELRQIFLVDVTSALNKYIRGVKSESYQQFECVKWFTKYGFTFAEKGDICDLIGKTKNDYLIVKTENGAVQMIDDDKFREHFGIRIEVDEAVLVICA